MFEFTKGETVKLVTPRMRRVSRNRDKLEELETLKGHASHEACE